MIRRHAAKSLYYTYLFFAIWFASGIVAHLQIIPLDMTAPETWFYFSMAGILGLVGVLMTSIPLRVQPQWLLLLACLIIGILGIRTGLRGLDFRNQNTLATKDIAAAGGNYVAYNTLATDLTHKGDYAAAKVDAEKSVAIYPTYINKFTLGKTLANVDNCPGSMTAYTAALRYNINPMPLSEQIGGLTLVCGTPDSDVRFLDSALHTYPHDSYLWMYLAIFEAKDKDSESAQYAIAKAAQYGPINQALYNDLIGNRPFTLNINDLHTSIYIP